MALQYPPQDPEPPRFTFLHALNGAIGRTPLWMTTTGVLVLLALVAALPWFSWYHDAIDNRYEPGALLQSLDETFRFDHRENRAALEAGTASTGAVLALLAMLFGAFAAGGWLQVFLERTEGHSLRRFFYGGSRYFFRFFRVLLLTLLSLSLAGFVLYGLPWQWLVEDVLLGLGDEGLEALTSELSARRVVFVQDGLFFLTAALILLWGDYTRARLAIHDTSSSVWAGLCSWVTILAHPIRVVRPMLLLWVAEAIVLWAAWMASTRIEKRIDQPGDWLPLLLLLLTGLLVLSWRSIVRGARYAAALDISAQLVRPLARPDPWKSSVGGPGGPRYPIGGDEYGVSL